ncbi:MAG TPA: ABC-type transport auxiliary lipoprotein family protein [Allosphingosinicella sp.]|uniref:ABC-type transport auxiliary lipoprotein family protein n=1 Tax=Allosphingosinicella sp. TaxID=2823234 RepID=UPI002ED80341
MKTRSLIAASAALALAGCGLGGKTPDLLLNLTPEVTVPESGRTSNAENAITVVRPTVPQALDTTRVPVMEGQSVTYLKDAFWVDTPDNLFRRLLSETIGARTGRVVLDPLQFSFNPGHRLTGQLQNFGLDATRMEAVVTYDAALARGAENVTTRRFEARVPVAAADRNNVAPALNAAANRVATEVAGWIGG